MVYIWYLNKALIINTALTTFKKKPAKNSKSLEANINRNSNTDFFEEQKTRKTNTALELA